MKGQVGTGQVETGQVQKSQVGTGHVQTSQFRTIQDGIGLVKTVQVRTGQVRTGLVRTGQVSIICQPVTGQVWTSQVGDKSIWNLSNLVGTSQVNHRKVKLDRGQKIFWTPIFRTKYFFGSKKKKFDRYFP